MKKSKKFVLAGLALLAITMVLLPLSGCKTEVDTSSPQQEQPGDSTGNNGSTGTGENAGSGDNNDSTNTEDNTSGGGDSGTGGGDTGDNPSAGNDGENAGSGGNGSTGGNAGTGNNGSTDTGENAGTGGNGSTGGNAGTGNNGSTDIGENAGTGGNGSTGGNAGTGNNDSTGTGGNAGTGGNGSTGGNAGTGNNGSTGTGENAGTGGNGSTGGNAGTGNNDSTDTSGNAGTGSDSNEDNKPEEPVVGTYTVKHLQQDASGDGYTPAADGSEEKAGTVGGDTEAEAKTYEGFTAQPVVQQKIAAGGATVVEIKYDRKTVTLQLDANGGSLADGGDTISGRYGADVEWSGNLTRSGHTFTGWSPELPATFSLDDEGRTYTAQWQPNQVIVEATAPVNPAEGTITKSDSGYTFTADFGDNASGAYAWFVDGERQECTDQEFTWDTSSVAAGVHEIRVEFGGNDARTTVEVKK